MKQVFLASTLFELVCLAAGIDGGEYDRPAAPALLGTGGLGPEDAPGPAERILLVSNNAVVMELSDPFTAIPGAESLLTRFDRVVDLNEALAPLHVHPSSWRPDHADLPIVESYLRRLWGLDEDEEIELVLESPQVNPAIALGRVFSRATIRVHADGLMSFGPTRSQIPLTNGQRMSVLHYLPLVPGISPRLLHEYDIVHRPASFATFTEVVREFGEASAEALDAELGDVVSTRQPWALVVGQYLSALGLISSEEETQLHIDMIEAAVARGMEVIVFKPHPAAPPSQTGPLFEAAERLSVTLQVLDQPVLAEVVIDRLSPALIVGGFSTALMTAREIYRVPALAVGTDLLLEAITPYQNSNRVPLTIIAENCDGSDPDDGDGPTAPGSAAPSAPDSAGTIADQHPQLARLLGAVTYCMAPGLSHDLRQAASDFLAEVFDDNAEPSSASDAAHADRDSITAPTTRADRYRRYFKRRRLTMLALPGSTSRAFAPKRIIKRSGTLVIKAVARKQKRIMKRIQSR